jgi:hypothetical protein
MGRMTAKGRDRIKGVALRLSFDGPGRCRTGDRAKAAESFWTNRPPAPSPMVRGDRSDGFKLTIANDK